MTVKSLGSAVRLLRLHLLSSTTDRTGDLGRVSEALHASVKRLIVTVVRVKTNSPGVRDNDMGFTEGSV